MYSNLRSCRQLEQWELQMLDTLKPCPFCGSDPDVSVRTYKPGPFSIQCPEAARCKVYLEATGQLDDVVEAWNTRAPSKVKAHA